MLQMQHFRCCPAPDTHGGHIFLWKRAPSLTPGTSCRRRDCCISVASTWMPSGRGRKLRGQRGRSMRPSMRGEETRQYFPTVDHSWYCNDCNGRGFRCRDVHAIQPLGISFRQKQCPVALLMCHSRMHYGDPIIHRSVSFDLSLI